MSTYDLSVIKKLSKHPTPSNLDKLRRIASEQTERRDNIVMRDMALGYARKAHGDERKAYLFDAAHAVLRLSRLPYGNRSMRRAAERATRSMDAKAAHAAARIGSPPREGSRVSPPRNRHERRRQAALDRAARRKNPARATLPALWTWSPNPSEALDEGYVVVPKDSAGRLVRVEAP